MCRYDRYDVTVSCVRTVKRVGCDKNLPIIEVCFINCFAVWCALFEHRISVFIGNRNKHKMNTIESKPDEGSRNRIILEETFYVLTKKNSVFRVQLTKKGICLIKESQNQTKEQMVPIKDIVGCKSLRSKKQISSCACQTIPRTTLKVVDENSGEQDDSDVSAYLYIYAYILQNNKTCKRERTIITLRFRSFDKYEDNNKEAQKWRTGIKRLIRGENINGMSISDFTDRSKFKENRRLLILLNPKSGSGKSRVIFQQKVAPILQEAEVPYDLHITKYANYAREFVRKCNLFQWTAVIVVSAVIF